MNMPISTLRGRLKAIPPRIRRSPYNGLQSESDDPGMADDQWHPAVNTPLGDCRGWCLRIRCGLCDRVGTFRLVDAAGVYGRTRTVAQIVARLGCQQCGRSPFDVQLIATDDRGVTEAVRIG
jgi:hypothetical protein